ncbi:hypothetical protein RHIZ_20935 [Rhizobium skierniewicense]|uniref:hypothetical protein n=1 Tax=Rhizobium skierniewicense TaxID=984260 RepID=UPI001FABB2A0|nr:hypothetical protein [Rhizobium skierniewicense]MCI9868435.1 hypothetical protein [Rhizobium skierniewicense]
MDQKMQSTDQREKLKIRYKQLLKLYVIIFIAALPIALISWALQYIPLIGITGDHFMMNARALADLSVARVLFATWCLVATAALWIERMTRLFAEMSNVFEDAAIAVVGGMSGLALAGLYWLLFFKCLVIGVMFIFLSFVIRVWIAKDTREFAWLRWLATASAIGGLFASLIWPGPPTVTG